MVSGSLSASQAQINGIKGTSSSSVVDFPSLEESHRALRSSASNPQFETVREGVLNHKIQSNTVVSTEGETEVGGSQRTPNKADEGNTVVQKEKAPNEKIHNLDNKTKSAEEAFEVNSKDVASVNLEPVVKKSWRALFSSPTAVSPQKNWKFTPSEFVKGKRVVLANSSNTSGAVWCEKLVIGFFIGKGLSFSAVKVAVENFWKLKKEVSIRAFGNGAFIFEFSDEEDRTQALEMGSFYISSKLFSLRPWSPLIEKTVTDIKLIPIWVCIYGVPLHLWDVDGLGLIASYIGKPILADECTINKSRLSYARICIEIDIDFEFPDCIPLLVDNEIAFDLPVEYQWKPKKCSTCRVFGHDTKYCSRIVKAKWIPKAREDKVGSGKGADVDQQDANERIEVTLVAVEDGLVNGQTAERELTDNVEVTGAANPVHKGESIPGKAKDVADAALGSAGIVGMGQLELGSAGSVGMGKDTSNNKEKKANLADSRSATAGYSQPSKEMASLTEKRVSESGILNSNVTVAKRILAHSDKENKKAGMQVESNLKNDSFLLTHKDKTNPELDGDWNTVRGRKQFNGAKKHSPSPKKNPFMVYSDFKSESRFPINRKKEDEEFEIKHRHLSEEEKIVKKQEREMKRLKWSGYSDTDGPESVGRGMRSQQKKK